MDAHMLLADLHSRGIRLIPDGEKLWAEPAEQLSDADRVAIRQSKAELMRILAENAALPSLLVAIADAIADAPRSPILNDLALSKAATSFVAAQRAAQAAPPALRAEIQQIAADGMTLAAREIRRSNYQAAYDALDILAGKVRELRAH
jgi:TubC N-terminal docking domain